MNRRMLSIPGNATGSADSPYSMILKQAQVVKQRNDSLSPFPSVVEQVHLEADPRVIFREPGQFNGCQGRDVAVYRHDGKGRQGQHGRGSRDGSFRERVGLLSHQVIERLASSVGDQPALRHDLAVQPLDQAMPQPQGTGTRVRIGYVVHEIKPNSLWIDLARGPGLTEGKWGRGKHGFSEHHHRCRATRAACLVDRVPHGRAGQQKRLLGKLERSIEKRGDRGRFQVCLKASQPPAPPRPRSPRSSMANSRRGSSIAVQSRDKQARPPEHGRAEPCQADRSGSGDGRCPLSPVRQRRRCL